MWVPKCGAACSVYFMDSATDLSTMIAVDPEHFNQMLPVFQAMNLHLNSRMWPSLLHPKSGNPRN